MFCGQIRSHPTWWRSCTPALFAVALVCSFILLNMGTANAVAEPHSSKSNPSYTSKQYGTVYDVMAKRQPAKVDGLPKPGAEKPRHRTILYWRLHPDHYYEWTIERLPPREAAAVIWREEFDWSAGEIAAGRYVIDHENSSWNPCRGFGESPDISCAASASHNGDADACGIPQFVPCRVYGDKVAQLRAYAIYVEGRYNGPYGAMAHKQEHNWY